MHNFKPEGLVSRLLPSSSEKDGSLASLVSRGEGIPETSLRLSQQEHHNISSDVLHKGTEYGIFT